MNDLHKILSKAMNDPRYAATLKENPEEAMKQAGVEPSPEKAAALREAVDCLSRTNQYFGAAMTW